MGIQVEGAPWAHPDAFVILLAPDGSRADVYVRGLDGRNAIWIGTHKGVLDVHSLAAHCRVLLSASNRADEAKPSGEF